MTKTYTEQEMNKAIQQALIRGRAGELYAAQKLEILTTWSDVITKTDSALQNMTDALGLMPESTICKTVWELQERLTITTSELLGGCDGWLEWYDLENSMGAKGMEAGTDTKMRKIRTVKDLLWLMEATR